MDTRNILSSQLREGMIVHAYGMRLALGPVTRRDDAEHGPLFWATGTVMNSAEVEAERFVPVSWWRDGWTVQGNDNRRWAVEA